MLSARDIIPLDEVLEANDFDSEGLYTEKGVVPMIEVDERLLARDELDRLLNELVNAESWLIDLGGSGRMFVGSLVRGNGGGLDSSATCSTMVVAVVIDVVLEVVDAEEGLRSRSLKAAYRSATAGTAVPN